MTATANAGIRNVIVPDGLLHMMDMVITAYAHSTGLLPLPLLLAPSLPCSISHRLLLAPPAPPPLWLLSHVLHSH